MKGKDVDSRIEWLRSVCRICLDYSVLPVMWDTGIDISRYEPFSMSEQLQEVYAGIPQSGISTTYRQE